MAGTCLDKYLIGLVTNLSTDMGRALSRRSSRTEKEIETFSVVEIATQLELIADSIEEQLRVSWSELAQQ